ncbi:AAA family ATPase [Actinomadura rubrisoli]|uniref:HTH cro/C1-type domain-containing protein n=1 Tax=Actinomadura rubrisoli TaxID=2530368 RepID=A0A4R5BXJ5_9ACTN|nr:AAA family ATPase [Actinomadura rubrisoli]TDD90403.1 hypothetical protein E1298_13160 [Actinomadura rubrisoli]
MPRPERPLSSESPPLLEFASDLRLLREKAGKPTYRQLSESAHYSVTVLAQAAAGRKLPSLAVTLAYVDACGGDVDEWRARWHSVAADLESAAAAAPAEKDRRPPFLGLAPFQPSDADRFFGRDELIDQLLRRVRQRRFVGVFGASGSGKSSLLRAGLLARAENRPTMIITPGPHPMDELALRLARATGRPAEEIRADLAADPANLHPRLQRALLAKRRHADALLIVDQFEETFTLCSDETERARFIEALVHAANRRGSRVRVVLGVRADFYGHCGRHPELAAALRDAQILVGPMSAAELHQAITKPAVAEGYVIESALVSRLIAEAAAQPASLPLVSHALLETWRRRRGTRLTVQGYEEAGGIQHAIARTAEEVYTSLDPEGRIAAKRIFLRLVSVEQDTADAKCCAGLHSFGESGTVTMVMERLAAARLIQLDDNCVQITHEALIRCWPRLRDWLTDDRESLRLHQQLAAAAETWEALQENPDALYRGTRLARAKEWADGNDGALTGRERRFLAAGLAAEAAEQATAATRTRRLRQAVVLLACLLLVAVTSVGYAVHSQRLVADQRNQALASNVITQAAAMRDENPPLALRLALAAHRLAPSQATRDSLFSTFAAPYATLLTGHRSDLVAIAYQPGKAVLATASWDRTAVLWDVRDINRPRRLATLTLPDSLKAVSFSSDGRLMATASGGAAQLWDVTDPARPARVSTFANATRTVGAVAFGPDGRIAATGNGDRTAQLWDLTDPRRPSSLAGFPAHAGPLGSPVFSPDGRRLLTVGGRTARLWDIGDRRSPRPLGRLSGHTGVVAGGAFSPTAPVVATASWDHSVRLWDISRPGDPVPLQVLRDHDALVWSVAFSPDGTTLASQGRTLRLWDVTRPGRAREVAVLPGGAYTTAFSPDGASIAVPGRAGLRLQDVRELPLADHRDVVAAVTFSPDGHTLATASWDRTVRLWDVTDPHRRSPLGVLTEAGGFVRSVDFSPDGRLLASGSDDGNTRVYAVADPRRPVLRATLPAKDGEVTAVAISPDGRLLAAGSERTISLWDLTEPASPRRLTQIPAHGRGVHTVGFSRDGRVLSTSGGADAGRLWDVTDPAVPRELPFPFRGDEIPSQAFSADGTLLATIADRQTVRLVDIRDIRRPRQVALLTGHSGTVYAGAFTPDGRRLATSGADHTAKLWDIGDPRRPALIGTFSGHTSDVPTVAFSPDGHTMATGSNDYTVKLWETDLGRITARICALATTGISDADWKRYFPGVPHRDPCANR